MQDNELGLSWPTRNQEGKSVSEQSLSKIKIINSILSVLSGLTKYYHQTLSLINLSNSFFKNKKSSLVLKNLRLKSMIAKFFNQL